MNISSFPEFTFRVGPDPNSVNDYYMEGRHGSTVVSTAASQLQGPGFESRLG